MSDVRFDLTLGDDEAPSDPLTLFGTWYSEARSTGMYVPEAVAVATMGEDGFPSMRMVLLKAHGADGFVFFTNYDSAKAQELERSGKTSLLFWWRNFQRQVRLSGVATRTDPATNEAYFASRARGSQVGAWASQQSAPVASREALDARFREFDARNRGRDVLRCPEFWGGYRVVPERFEFWQGRHDRMHDRVVYLRHGDGWRRDRLMP